MYQSARQVYVLRQFASIMNGSPTASKRQREHRNKAFLSSASQLQLHAPALSSTTVTQYLMLVACFAEFQLAMDQRRRRLALANSAALASSAGAASRQVAVDMALTYTEWEQQLAAEVLQQFAVKYCGVEPRVPVLQPVEDLGEAVGEQPIVPSADPLPGAPSPAAQSHNNTDDMSSAPALADVCGKAIDDGGEAAAPDVLSEPPQSLTADTVIRNGGNGDVEDAFAPIHPAPTDDAAQSRRSDDVVSPPCANSNEVGVDQAVPVVGVPRREDPVSQRAAHEQATGRVGSGTPTPEAVGDEATGNVRSKHEARHSDDSEGDTDSDDEHSRARSNYKRHDSWDDENPGPGRGSRGYRASGSGSTRGTVGRHSKPTASSLGPRDGRSHTSDSDANANETSLRQASHGVEGGHGSQATSAETNLQAERHQQLETRRKRFERMQLERAAAKEQARVDAAARIANAAKKRAEEAEAAALAAQHRAKRLAQETAREQRGKAAMNAVHEREEAAKAGRRRKHDTLRRARTASRSHSRKQVAPPEHTGNSVDASGSGGFSITAPDAYAMFVGSMGLDMARGADDFDLAQLGTGDAVATGTQHSMRSKSDVQTVTDWVTRRHAAEFDSNGKRLTKQSRVSKHPLALDQPERADVATSACATSSAPHLPATDVRGASSPRSAGHTDVSWRQRASSVLAMTQSGKPSVTARGGRATGASLGEGRPGASNELVSDALRRVERARVEREAAFNSRPTKHWQAMVEAVDLVHDAGMEHHSQLVQSSTNSVGRGARMPQSPPTAA